MSDLEVCKNEVTIACLYIYQITSPLHSIFIGSGGVWVALRFSQILDVELLFYAC